MVNNVKKEFASLGYKVSGTDIDFNNLDPECIFIGDVYIVKYKKYFSWDDSFEDATEKKLVMNDAILLRIGFERYINLSDILTSKDMNKVKETLRKDKESKKLTILGSFFKPFADDKIALNVKALYDLNESINKHIVTLDKLHQVRNNHEIDFKELKLTTTSKVKLKVLRMFKK